jgi:hypothetical protein
LHLPGLTILVIPDKASASIAGHEESQTTYVAGPAERPVGVDILAALDTEESPDRLRAFRAVEVLEYAATREVKEVLQKLAA